MILYTYQMLLFKATTGKLNYYFMGVPKYTCILPAPHDCRCVSKIRNPKNKRAGYPFFAHTYYVDNIII